MHPLFVCVDLTVEPVNNNSNNNNKYTIAICSIKTFSPRNRMILGIVIYKQKRYFSENALPIY